MPCLGLPPSNGPVAVKLGATGRVGASALLEANGRGIGSVSYCHESEVKKMRRAL